MQPNHSEIPDLFGQSRMEVEKTAEKFGARNVVRHDEAGS
jgi:hypothetical protein